MDAAISADPDRHEEIIAENEKDHAASGHWGVPTFVFENEPFFGQDRIQGADPPLAYVDGAPRQPYQTPDVTMNEQERTRQRHG
jgi:hypothetical protein